mmetsp:Transcript_27049/g.67374  ORF Transcript_27049/g.67374 Transcript_27049/m.67374 type:complete len:469 (-) Transcript_27049:1218-2624(-)
MTTNTVPSSNAQGEGKTAAVAGPIFWGLMLVWALAIIILGVTGASVGQDWLIGPINFISINAIIAAYLFLPAFRRHFNTLDLQLLSSIHIWRIIPGVLFFYYGFVKGSLPHFFTWAAGTGDILVGVVALPIALMPLSSADRLTATERRQRRSFLLTFTVFALCDWVVAVGSGIGSNILTVPKIETLTTFPLFFVPAFQAPFNGAITILTLIRLIRGVEEVTVSKRAAEDREREGETRPAAVTTASVVGIVFFTFWSMWAMAAWVLASTGVTAMLHTGATPAVVASFSIVQTLVYFCGWFGFREFVHSLNLQAVAAYNMWRLPAGISFLYYGLVSSKSTLPVMFGWNAGIGDVVHGLWAFVMAFIPHPQDVGLVLSPPGASSAAGKKDGYDTLALWCHRAHVAFHIAGLAEFVLPMMTGMLSWQLGNPLANHLMHFPIVLIPWVGVASTLPQHVYVLHRLLTKTFAAEA